MSLHDFTSPRAGLADTLVLHLHDPESRPSSSPSTSPDGYIMVPRRPLAAKSHNVQPSKYGDKLVKSACITPEISLAVPSRPCTPPALGLDATTNASFCISLSRPCTPFQPLPPLVVTSPLRLPSFIDLALRSFDSDPPPSPASALSLAPESEPPSPSPPKLSITIPSVSHPNSPYVPWASPVRRTILRPLTPSSQISRYSRPFSRSGARAPEPEDDVQPPPPPSRLLRLSRSFKNLKKSVKQGVKHVKNALRTAPKCKRSQPAAVPTVVPPVPALPSAPPPLPSPSPSANSTNTTTLAEWLRECAASVERATPNLMTLEEYEERGSWRDTRSVQDESRMCSPLFSDVGDDDDGASQRFPASTSMSPTPTSDVFPRLSMLDVWPTPPRSVPQARNFFCEMRREATMPGGWNSPQKSPPA